MAYLEANGLREEGIFRVPGSASQLDELRAAFERDEDPLEDTASSAYSVESVAGLFKLFFRMLPNPVFPRKLYSTFVAVSVL